MHKYKVEKLIYGEVLNIYSRWFYASTFGQSFFMLTT